MILFKGIVDGYDIEVKTTPMYDAGEITSADDDEPSCDICVKGNGTDIKAPIWGIPPKVITEGMMRGFLRSEGL